MRVSAIGVYFVLLAAVSCKKDPKLTVTPGATENPATEKRSSLVFSFNALVNNSKLIATNKAYTNAGQDLFTVTRFSYYISNIRLTREDGQVFAEPESYHLINHVDGKTSFTVTGLPEGTYTSVDFLIGVDVERNRSGAQNGDLDVTNGMFWDWDQGYVFFKLEGSYLAKNQSAEAYYAIHVGGFEGKYNCIKQCHFNAPTSIAAKESNVVKLTYTTVIDEIFVNPKTIAINDYLVSPSDSCMKMVADNYADMFQLTKVEN